MHPEVRKRKKEILSLLQLIKKYSVRKKFRHEMMTYAYILSNGAIEFMIETTLREWVKENINKHNKSVRYFGRKSVATYLKNSAEVLDLRVQRFNNPSSCNGIGDLIKDVAGEDAKNRFVTMVGVSRVMEPELDAKLKRINDFRHRVAHGVTLPQDEQPNIDELIADFKSVYKHIVVTVEKSLK